MTQQREKPQNLSRKSLGGKGRYGSWPHKSQFVWNDEKIQIFNLLLAGMTKRDMKARGHHPPSCTLRLQDGVAPSHGRVRFKPGEAMKHWLHGEAYEGREATGNASPPALSVVKLARISCLAVSPNTGRPLTGDSQR